MHHPKAPPKRVRIQSAHGILTPGGSPRWRARPHTATYLAAAFVLYGLLATTRSIFLHDDLLPLPPPLDFNTAHTSSSSSSSSSRFVYEVGGNGEDCPEYGHYAAHPHQPLSSGKFALGYQRPAKRCRKVVVEEVEQVIREMNATVRDPDLFRLFENCFPNTLDTSVGWTGVAGANAQEELTFITTGDIHAMWLRDSANQLQSYVSLLKPVAKPKKSSSSSSSQSRSGAKEQGDDAAADDATSSSTSEKLPALFRGAINLQARYILASPHCNAFQPPVEADMAPGNDGNPSDLVFPSYDPAVVFECKYELDSLAAFLQLSWDYFSRTKDDRFFVEASSSGNRRRKTKTKMKKGNQKSGRKNGGYDGWKDAVITILDTAEAMRVSTYDADGLVVDSPYRFERVSSVPTETLGNRGNGNPVKGGTGLVRSGFRPSDDATTYQLLIPANMMLARYLELCAEIMAKVEKEEEKIAATLGDDSAQDTLVDNEADSEEEEEEQEQESNETVTERMRRMAKEIKKGIDKHAKVKHPKFGEIYAYEVDGFFSHNMMVSQDLNACILLSTHMIISNHMIDLG